ncbi:MAG TPA: diguanylate cyclase [Smithellaceae bacterium]|nr:diguanylate cyclase [Smithellaceae bacterium]
MTQSFYTIYVVSLFIASTINTVLAVFSCYRYHTREAKALAYLLFATAIITASAAFSALSNTSAAADFWLTRIRFIGVASLPVFFLAFIFEYEGRIRLLTKRYLPLLFLIPLTTIILIWTNHHHGLFLQNISYRQFGFFILRDSWKPGIWFWVHSLYSYIFIIYGIIILLRKIFNTQQPWRGQVIMLFIGALFPLLANIIVLMRIIPGPALDLTAFGMTITGIMFFLALYRYRLLNIMPIAGERIIENMRDAVIVLDNKNRIIHLNPSMLAIIGEAYSGVIGKYIKEVLPHWLHKIDAVINISEPQTETFVINDEQENYFEVNSSPLYQRQESTVIGQLIVLHDITAQTVMMKEKELLINKLEFTQSELKMLAVTDPLTGLYNRRHFFHLAEHEFKRAVRYGSSLSILMSDIDLFKKVNDNYGHVAGDYVLSMISGIIKKNLRTVDILARFGGEEFIIILPETNITAARGIAERIRLEIAESSISFNDNVIKTTISIGLASLDENVVGLEDLIKKADDALYRAKDSGRNQVYISE